MAQKDAGAVCTSLLASSSAAFSPWVLWEPRATILPLGPPCWGWQRCGVSAEGLCSIWLQPCSALGSGGSCKRLWGTRLGTDGGFLSEGGIWGFECTGFKETAFQI